MSENAYGWGYLQNMVGTTVGVAGSIQVRVDNTTLNGDSGFVYNAATGIVTITKGLEIAGIPFGMGNQFTVSAGTTQQYQQNSLNVIHTADNDIVTIESGATMKIGLNATVKMKRYSEV